MRGQEASSRLRHTEVLPSPTEVVSKAVAFPDTLKCIPFLFSFFVPVCETHPSVTLLPSQSSFNKRLQGMHVNGLKNWQKS